MTETFNFPYHTVGTDYSDNSTRVQFGRGYVFASRPEAPPQRLFTLTLKGMKWVGTWATKVSSLSSSAKEGACEYVTSSKIAYRRVSGAWLLLQNVSDLRISKSTSTLIYFVNLVDEPAINVGILEEFYLRHELWNTFWYAHPTCGTRLVRFNKPLKIPPGIENGRGVIDPMALEFIEVR